MIMSSLADKIINSKHRSGNNIPPFFGIELDLPEYDECGLPTSDTLEYFVARLIAYDQKDTDGHLHMRDDGRIWKGYSWIAENTDNLYRIAKWTKPIKPYEREIIWKKVREVLPNLSKDKLVVTDNLVWNRKEAKLEYTEQKPNTIK